MQELTRIRNERGWSQQKLSDVAKVNKATINQIERGRRSPNVETLEKLATALGVELGDLFPKAQAPLPLDDSAGKAHGVNDPVAAARAVVELREISVGLASLWNQDAELYGRRGWGLRPYRTLEMSLALDSLYRQLWGALAALQRHAEELGQDPNPATWEQESRQLLLDAATGIRALAELRAVIARGAASPDADGDNFRTLREEFVVGGPDVLSELPQFPETMEKARAAVGLA